jgi:Outer membrane protein beta-barrel domain
MTKPTVLVPMIAGLVLTMAAAAHAQILPDPEPEPESETESGVYVSLAVGGQPQTRSFGSSGTFTSFNETGRYDLTQKIGGGVLFDVGGGYRFTKNLSVGVGLWNTRSKSAASAAAAIPDPVFFGRFTTVSASQSDLKQSTIGVNIFVTYTRPLAKRFDVAVSGGPTIVHTRLDAGSVSVTPISRNLSLAADSQSKTGAKAGNIGADFTYHVNGRYSAGFFVRYAGGELDLPAVKSLKVGSVQTGGLMRYRF